MFDPSTAAPVKGFDPASAKPTDLTDKFRIGAGQAINEKIAPVQALGKIASGMGASVASGYAGVTEGIRSLFAGNGIDKAVDDATARINDTQSNLTYEPDNPIAQQGADILTKPMQWLDKGADYVGGKVAEVTNSPAIGAATKAAIEVLAPIKGAKVAGRIVDGVQAAETAAAAERARIASLNAPTRAGIKAANDLGFTILPSEAQGGAVTRGLETLSGDAKLAKLNSIKNASVVNDLVRQDVGLPTDQPITREALSQVRKQAGAAYEPIKAISEIPTDKTYIDAIDNVSKPYEVAAESFKKPDGTPLIQNPVADLAAGLKQPAFSGASAVEMVKMLRDKADTAMGGQMPDKGLANSYRALASAVDDAMNRHLQTLTDPATKTAVADYQQARKTIAKSYLAEEAINPDTGNINPTVYAKAHVDGAPLDGAALAVGKFANQFPRSAQAVEKLGSPSGPAWTDLLLSTMGSKSIMSSLGASTAAGVLNPAAGAATAGLVMARPLTRMALASKFMQDQVAQQTPLGQGMVSRLVEEAAKGQQHPATIAMEIAAEKEKK